MPRGGAGISLIERPVDQAIKEHGGGSRCNHADKDENQRSRRRQTVRCDDQSAERKRQGEDRMGKPNELKKSAEGVGLLRYGGWMSIFGSHNTK